VGSVVSETWWWVMLGRWRLVVKAMEHSRRRGVMVVLIVPDMRAAYVPP
jgi:hypothetical protein